MSGRESPGRFRRLVIAVGMTTLVLVLMEVAAFGLRMLYHRLGSGDPRASQPVYAEAGYDARALFEELRALELRYVPFLTWSRRPFDGQFINIGEEGRRRTCFSSTSPEALRIWVFGGSTIWGTGVPNCETIPSFLARELNRDPGTPIIVRNYGETGYVSTQQLIYLLRELQQARRPDIVIFYDGVNDAGVASEGLQRVGEHGQVLQARVRFEGGWRDLLSRTSLYEAVDWLVKRIAPGSPPEGASIGPEELGGEAARLWLVNYDAVRALGDRFGFLPLFFLQPQLTLGEKGLTDTEQGFLESRDARLPFRLEVARQMRDSVRHRLSPGGAAYEHVFDITDALDRATNQVYIDAFHLAAPGNRWIAGRIAEILRRVSCPQQEQVMADRSSQLCTGAGDGRPQS